MLFAVLNPVHPFPTKQSFQPSSCRLIQTQVTENLLFLNLSPAHSCFLSGFQDKSMIQKCKQTTHQALNSFPSLTSISKTCFSDTCRLKSDCCKQACCSFSWKFLPLLSSATTNCGLGYFGKKKKNIIIIICSGLTSIHLYCYLQHEWFNCHVGTPIGERKIWGLSA